MAAHCRDKMWASRLLAGKQPWLQLQQMQWHLPCFLCMQLRPHWASSESTRCHNYPIQSNSGFWHTPSTPCLWSEKKTILMSDRRKKLLSNACVLTLAQTPGWALSKCLSGSVVFFSGHRSHFSLHSLLGEPVGKGASTAFLEREKKSFQRKCFCCSFKWKIFCGHTWNQIREASCPLKHFLMCSK